MLRRRLLLVLFGLGTNMGIRRVAVTGQHGESGATLRGVRQLFVNRTNNATFAIRDEMWWDTGTAYASDNRKFGAWSSNLMIADVEMRRGIGADKLTDADRGARHDDTRGLRARPEGGPRHPTPGPQPPRAGPGKRPRPRIRIESQGAVRRAPGTGPVRKDWASVRKAATSRLRSSARTASTT